MEQHSTLKREKIIQFNEEAVRDHLGEMVRSTVEETLNQMLEAEADRLCNAERYERTEARVDTRAGQGYFHLARPVLSDENGEY